MTPMLRFLGYVAVAVVGFGLYAHPDVLNGEFVYDDGGTVTGNPVVQAQHPWSDIWVYDFWGRHKMVDPASHKSFRPITSMTLRWNFERVQLDPYEYHLTNAVLHMLVCLLVVPATWHALGGAGGVKGADTASLVTAVIFAVHPVHSEAVANVTGRAEVLMSLFFLAGFLVYAVAIQAEQPPASNTSSSLHQGGQAVKWTALVPSIKVWLASGVMLACMTLALLSKEMGATLPMLCAFWDFFTVSKLSLRHLALVTTGEEVVQSVVTGGSNAMEEQDEGQAQGQGEGEQVQARGEAQAPSTPLQGSKDVTLYDGLNTEQEPVLPRLRRWVLRTTLLALGTLTIFAWRIRLNGGSPAYFRFNSNRPAIETIDGTVPAELIIGPDVGVHGVYRWLSIMWVWCHYLGTCCYPRWLCPDWSGPSVGLVRSFSDPRVPLILATVGGVMGLAVYGGCGATTRPRLMTVLAFYGFPFLLSANIFIVVGTTVAERVIYLPSLAVCMAIGVVLGSGDLGPWHRLLPAPATLASRRTRSMLARLLVLALVVSAMSIKCLERNFAWSTQLRLWAAAYQVNPGSAHICRNYGINLSLNNDLPKAIEVLDSIRFMHPVDQVDEDEIWPTLAMCLRVSGRWVDALYVLAEAWVGQDQRQAAVDKGIQIWHMHELMPSGEQRKLRRGRLLATQATVLTNIDIKEAASIMLRAVAYAHEDSLVMRLARDLEEVAQKMYSMSPQQQQQQQHQFQYFQPTPPPQPPPPPQQASPQRQQQQQQQPAPMVDTFESMMQMKRLGGNFDV